MAFAVVPAVAVGIAHSDVERHPHFSCARLYFHWSCAVDHVGSSVSSSSRCTAGPVSTTLTSLSPPRIPDAMRESPSLPGADARFLGDEPPGWAVSWGFTRRLVQRDERSVSVDHVVEDNHAAVLWLRSDRAGAVSGTVRRTRRASSLRSVGPCRRSSSTAATRVVDH